MSTDTAPAKKSRLTARRPKDMIISLAVLLVPIGLIFVGWRFLMSGQDVTPVDYSETVAEAQRAGLAVIEPEGLSDAWVPISHSVEDGGGVTTLRIGYHTPEAAGLQLVESDADRDTVVDVALGSSAKPDGSREVGDQTWTVYRTDDGHTGYVAETEESTIAVVGDAGRAELDEFVAALD